MRRYGRRWKKGVRVRRKEEEGAVIEVREDLRVDEKRNKRNDS